MFTQHFARVASSASRLQPWHRLRSCVKSHNLSRSPAPSRQTSQGSNPANRRVDRLQLGSHAFHRKVRYQWDFRPDGRLEWRSRAQPLTDRACLGTVLQAGSDQGLRPAGCGIDCEPSIRQSTVMRRHRSPQRATPTPPQGSPTKQRTGRHPLAASAARQRMHPAFTPSNDERPCRARARATEIPCEATRSQGPNSSRANQRPALGACHCSCHTRAHPTDERTTFPDSVRDANHALGPNTTALDADPGGRRFVSSLVRPYGASYGAQVTLSRSTEAGVRVLIRSVASCCDSSVKASC